MPSSSFVYTGGYERPGTTAISRQRNTRQRHCDSLHMQTIYVRYTLNFKSQAHNIWGKFENYFTKFRKIVISPLNYCSCFRKICTCSQCEFVFILDNHISLYTDVPVMMGCDVFACKDDDICRYNL